MMEACRLAAIHQIARLEGMTIDEAVDGIIEAGIRVLLQKHRQGCGPES